MTDREKVARALAPKAWNTDHPGDGWEMARKHSLDQADRVLAALRPEAQGVKPLQWVSDDFGGDGEWGNGLFNYQVRGISGGSWKWRRATEGRWYIGIATKDEAKAAAQADYSARILSALDRPEAQDGVAEDIRAMIKEAQDEITANMTDVMPSRDVENLFLGRKIGLEMALARLARAED